MPDAKQQLDGAPAARVAVLGASGFAGALAADICWRHPRLELVAVTARQDAGRRLDDLYPRYRVPLTLAEPDLDALSGADAALVAYPHGAAAPVVAGPLDRGLKVVDLSADFRLTDRDLYEQWYGEHGAPERFGTAAYGLTELNREAIARAELVANPGCYPTATILALAPLAEKGLVARAVVDAKSGVSGSGRGGGDSTHFVTVAENVEPYRIDGHRHEPEIEQEVARLGSGAGITFVPHLVPLDQGELVSCYVTLAEDVSPEELTALYEERWQDEPFVEFTERPPGMREVRDTNICRITVRRHARSGLAMAFASIDNLWKGAASQAVQNLNLMLGLDEGLGIS